MESNSYERIAEEMKMKPSSILFVTDIIGGKLLELSLWNTSILVLFENSHSQAKKPLIVPLFNKD